MHRYDNLLRSAAALVIAAGILGLAGAVAGWDKQLAAPQVLAGACGLAVLWGLLLLLCTYLIRADANSPLARPPAAKGINAVMPVAELALFVVGAITVHQASSWLYLSLVAVLVAVITTVLWTYLVIRRWNSGGRHDRNSVGTRPHLTRPEGIRLAIGVICAVAGALVTTNQKVVGLVLTSAGVVLLFSVAVAVFWRSAKPQ